LVVRSIGCCFLVSLTSMCYHRVLGSIFFPGCITASPAILMYPLVHLSRLSARGQSTHAMRSIGHSFFGFPFLSSVFRFMVITYTSLNPSGVSGDR